MLIKSSAFEQIFLHIGTIYVINMKIKLDR